MMLALLAATVIPLLGGTQLNVQVEYGDVHLVAASVHAVRVDAQSQGNAPVAHVHYSHVGNAIVVILTGHPPIHLPFVPGKPGNIVYTVTYPAAMSVEVSDSEGNLSVQNSRGRAAMQTKNGTVTAANAHGEIDLAADNGSIDAVLAPDWHATSIRMQSGNGDLHLAVPAAFRAHVDAYTDAGTVENAIHSTATHPFVWLYTEHGNVSIDKI